MRKNKIISMLLLLILCICVINPQEVLALTKEQKENADKIGSFLVSECGLKPYVAFGVLGNIYQESGFNPGSVNSSSGASGICQWTDGRRAKMIKTAGSNWKTNIDGQLEHLKNELNGPYKKSVYDKLKKLPDTKKGMEQAVEIFCKHFEVCGNYGSEVPHRIKKAEEVYKELGGTLSGYHAGGKAAYDFSLLQELLSPILNIKLSDGGLISTTKEERDYRHKLNLKIIRKTVENAKDNKSSSGGGSQSLYNRFGPKLQFVEYNGEVTEDIELGDHIVSAYVSDNDKNLEIIDDVLRYDSHIYLSTRVYKDRPPVLDVNMLKQGYIDPRAQLYKDGNLGKLYTLTFAKIRLAISSFIVGLVNLFTDNKFFVFILGAFKMVVTSPAWSVVRIGVNTILVIFLAVFIFSLVKHAMKFAKGSEPAGSFFTRFAIGILSIGLISLFLATPTSMLDKSAKVVNIVDDFINYSLSYAFKDDPTIFSSDGKYTMNAAVWKTTLFEPWCLATFGRPYEKCYTQFAEDKGDGEKLPQSYEPDHENPENSDDSDIFYDSAGCTGDVFVDLGGGKLERNWAAYALSTMSIYHIGNEVYEEEKDMSECNRFPNAMTTFRNKDIYADMFRWIDAKMNISPQYSTDEEATVFNNYGDSNGFETHYYKYSWDMLWRALLLAMLLPVIWFRLKSFLGIMYVAVKGIYYSLVELVKENRGLSSFWEDIKDNILQYAYHSIQLYILLFLYVTLVDKNFLLQLLFIVLAFVISQTSPRDLKNRATHLKNDIKRLAIR